VRVLRLSSERDSVIFLRLIGSPWTVRGISESEGAETTQIRILIFLELGLRVGSALIGVGRGRLTASRERESKGRKKTIFTARHVIE